MELKKIKNEIPYRDKYAQILAQSKHTPMYMEIKLQKYTIT